MSEIEFNTFSCPLPLNHGETVLLAHGSGSRLTHDLIQNVFKPLLDSNLERTGNDFADVASQPGRLITSTDSHIVKPLFFPGGDIGRLAVCGTINDVSMSGAQPLFLTAGFILEEGFLIEDLRKIVASMKAACDEAGVQVVAGDTKVVEKGKGDGLFINTCGFGWKAEAIHIHGANAQPGDRIIISGTVADHGMAIVSARGDLGLSSSIRSDVAPLNHMIQGMLSKKPAVHVLRDPTRGGVATTLNEIAEQSHVGIEIFGDDIPINPQTAAACELLGFDPLYVANEGKVLIFCSASEVDGIISSLNQFDYGQNARVIGKVVADHAGKVVLFNGLGGKRLLPMLAGEMLPRIC